MIKVDYDKEVDAKYVSIKKGVIHETQRLEDWLMLDLNKSGEVLGVEILDASKNKISLFTDGQDFITCITESWPVAPVQGDNFGLTFQNPEEGASSPKIFASA